VNGTSKSVSKIHMSDGTVLETYPVGDSPIGICFDGVNIWVTNSRSNNISKLRASDGKLLGTYPGEAGQSDQPGTIPPATTPKPTVTSSVSPTLPASSAITMLPTAVPTVTVTGTDEVVRIVIQGMWVSPRVIVVPVGSRVTWFNLDSWDHTVTSDGGLFDGYLRASAGTYSYTFTQPGTYNYHCRLHSPDKGTVVVR
jgi:plastocyanin